MKLIKMDLVRVVVFLLLSYCCSIFCFPSRPLNERSTELAWEAWLLVDDQNQNKQNNPDTPTRSRITPKSVFIAPTFSPESLPSCADGYRADKSGTCMQIIKLDENAHLEFLLQKLNEKFGSFEYDYDEGSQEEMPTPGPFQVNIPLDDGRIGEPASNPDIAIVVAPTNGNFDTGKDAVKVNVKRKDNDTKAVIEEEDIFVGLDGVMKNAETTTVDDRETTTMEITTPSTDETTTFQEMDEDKTEELTTETTTSQEETTTEMPQHALFYLEPLNDQPSEQLDSKKTENTEDSTKIPPKTEVEDITNKPVIEETMYSDSDSTQSKGSLTNNAQKLTSSHQPAASIIKFPDEPANLQRKKTPNIEEIEALIRDLIHTRGPTNINSNERHTFRHRDPPLISGTSEHDGLDLDIRHKLHGNHDRHSLGTNHGDRVFNHRNRDKWNLQQPAFRENTSPYSPIVLKFSNRPQNGRQAPQELFHQRHHPEGVYRKVPDDLSYIFGLKARPHISHR